MTLDVRLGRGDRRGERSPSRSPRPRLLCVAGNAQNTLAQPAVWLTIALTAAVCVLPVVAFRFLKLQLRPGLSDTVSWGARGGAEPAGRGLGTGAPWGSGRGPGARAGALTGPAPRPSPRQVRYSQLVRKKQKAQHRCLRRAGRSGSRRSGYAFSHQEGFGELIMSGKNMRLSSLALSGFGARSSTGWIESLRRKKSDCASSPGGGPDKPPRG